MKGRRILALDYGTKRIGVALSDELGWTAQPLETFERRTLAQDVSHIAQLVADHEVGQVLLGFPLQLDGREGPAIQAMRRFSTTLEQGLAVPLVLWDERMTTKAAEDLLIAADVSRKKRKGAVDRIAAAILLQSYLASLETPEQPVKWPDEPTEEATEESESKLHELADRSRAADRHGRRPRHGRVPGRPMG